MNTLQQTLQKALSELPLVAILRGIRPSEVAACADVLYEAGFRLIEVPLNSPDVWQSLAVLARSLPADALFGAGTVLTMDELQRVRDTGARLVVMPHTDAVMIADAVQVGQEMICMPGVSSVTEALAALNAGARLLKMYPAELITPTVLKAMRTVLPTKAQLFPVGGIDAQNMSAYRKAGADGFGLGGSLYRAGMSAEELRKTARNLIQAWHNQNSYSQ